MGRSVYVIALVAMSAYLAGGWDWGPNSFVSNCMCNPNCKYRQPNTLTPRRLNHPVCGSCWKCQLRNTQAAIPLLTSRSFYGADFPNPLASGTQLSGRGLSVRSDDRPLKPLEDKHGICLCWPYCDKYYTLITPADFNTFMCEGCYKCLYAKNQEQIRQRQQQQQQNPPTPPPTPPPPPPEETPDCCPCPDDETAICCHDWECDPTIPRPTGRRAFFFPTL